MSGRPTPQTIGERLKSAREARDWRPERLAAELEISVDTLFRYERGESPVSYLNIAKAAQLLDQPVEWFAQNGKRDAV